MRPRIGISTTPSSHMSHTLDIERPIDALDRSYVDSVEGAGGLPFLLPVVMSTFVPEIVRHLDGLVISGGGDVDPTLYGAVPAPETDGVDQARDTFEMLLIKEALAIDLPMLCICRGLQVLNVAQGGTLIQHLPDAEDRPNLDPANWFQGTHEVAVDGGTLLAELVGETVGVNSLHHQGLDRLGDRLRVVARDEAGVVEGVEVEGSELVIGVQWHPEMLQGDPDNDALFRWLVENAGRRASKASEGARSSPGSGTGG